MLKKFKLFGILNIVDVVIALVLILAVIVVFFAATGRYSRTPQVEQETKRIEFDVMLKNKIVTRDKNLFNAGDKAFIAIRNVPYTKLEVIRAGRTSAKTVIPNPKNRYKAIAVNDPSAPYVYDFLVTLADKAVITNDGAVVGGNKIKIGIPITLEGRDYKLSGYVSDVRVQEK